MPSVNHPNFRWQAHGRATSPPSSGVRLFEVYNGGPDVNNAGRTGRPATDEAWDIVLTVGRRLFGVATDDAHHFQVWGRYCNPGRGWVVVRAEDAPRWRMLTTLEAGDFYATMGIELADVDLSRRQRSPSTSCPRGHRTTRPPFIGRGGQLLDVVHGTSPRYRVTGSEGYVRARVDDSDGLRAWTQPAFHRLRTRTVVG